MTKTRDLADLGGGFIQAGTGAQQRTVESKLQDVVSVLDFIPESQHAAIKAGTSTYDATADIQAAIDVVAANSNGGIVFFPVGTYRVSSTISNNRLVTPTLGRVSLKGADQNGSKILFVGAGTCFDFKHAVSGVTDANVAYTEISDLTLITNAYAVGKYGIVIDIGGFAKLSRLNMQGWDYALYLQDVDQFYAEKLTLRFNNNGILCRKNPVPTAVSTQPNNHTYVSCCFSNNFSFGGVWDGGSELSFFGGNVEKNGNSLPTGGGLKFIDCGYEGGRGCNIQGVYFEGNQGLADLIIEATTVEATPILGAVHQVSSSFKRLSDASGFNATHNIYCNFGNPATVGKQQLVLIGSSFRVYSGYTESAATPFIKYNGVAADASNFFDFGSYYESSIEKPYFIQTVNKFDASVSKSTDQTFTTATLAQWLIDFNLNPTTYPLWVPDLTSNSILIPETGTYSISASLVLSTATAADKFLYIRKNGNNIGILNSNSGINVLSGSMTARLTAGDVLTFFYEQRTGSDQNIVGISNFSNVSVSKIF